MKRLSEKQLLQVEFRILTMLLGSNIDKKQREKIVAFVIGLLSGKENL